MSRTGAQSGCRASDLQRGVAARARSEDRIRRTRQQACAIQRPARTAMQRPQRASGRASSRGLLRFRSAFALSLGGSIGRAVRHVDLPNAVGAATVLRRTQREPRERMKGKALAGTRCARSSVRKGARTQQSSGPGSCGGICGAPGSCGLPGAAAPALLPSLERVALSAATLARCSAAMSSGTPLIRRCAAAAGRLTRRSAARTAAMAHERRSRRVPARHAGIGAPGAAATAWR
jgi:hypothetical protein